jgi:hypothetical protein
VKRLPPREIAFIVMALPGVVMPFLPFSGAKDRVPVLALCDWHETPWSILSIVLFAFLCVPILILASTVRQALWGAMTRGETWVAYGVSLVALTSIASFLLTAQGPHPALIGSALIWAIGAVAILASTMNSRLPRTEHAHVALLVAYVPSIGFFCILGFERLTNIGPGCWLAAIAILAYTVEAIIRVRRALRSEGGPEAEAQP